MVHDAIDECAFQVLLIELSFSPHPRHTYTQNHSHPLQLTVPISEYCQHGPLSVNGHFSSLLLFLVWNGFPKWALYSLTIQHCAYVTHSWLNSFASFLTGLRGSRRHGWEAREHNSYYRSFELGSRKIRLGPSHSFTQSEVSYVSKYLEPLLQKHEQLSKQRELSPGGALF